MIGKLLVDEKLRAHQTVACHCEAVLLAKKFSYAQIERGGRAGRLFSEFAKCLSVNQSIGQQICAWQAFRLAPRTNLASLKTSGENFLLPKLPSPQMCCVCWQLFLSHTYLAYIAFCRRKRVRFQSFLVRQPLHANIIHLFLYDQESERGIKSAAVPMPSRCVHRACIQSLFEDANGQAQSVS